LIIDRNKNYLANKGGHMSPEIGTPEEISGLGHMLELTSIMKTGDIKKFDFRPSKKAV